jgi:citrate/tricarballylate utilization protein
MRHNTEEGARIFRICNTCRYCEGFCAVYPAMERRTAFPPDELHFLANLCHNCGECYYACQYAPPHEFAVNVPLLLAKIRLESYEQCAWPRWFARAYRRNSVVVAGLLAFCLSAFLVARPRDFYASTALFTAAAGFVAVALGAGLVRFFRLATSGERVTVLAAITSLKDTLSLRYLASEQVLSRRLFHHLTSYGFLLCFASTAVAAVYHHVFHWEAPYLLLRAPVLLGTIGGTALAVGSAGLLVLKLRRDAALKDRVQSGMDFGFIALLFLTSASGLMLLAERKTQMMPVFLDIHLGSVLALFLTLPYGKFVHGIYRAAALLRNSLETTVR